MKLLAVKKDRLNELTKFGFERDDYDSYTYRGKRPCGEYRVCVMSWLPILSISEYDSDDFEDSTVVNVPDVVMDLIEAGMIERFK